MTSHLQWTITNVHASCLHPIDDVSFKCIQRCSGWADCTKWFKSYTLRLSCLNMTSNFQCKLSTPKRWCILQMYSKMQWTGCSRVIWRHWMVQITYLDIVLPWYDIPITVDNSQNCLPLIDPSNVFKDAVDKLFQVPRRLWMVQMTDLDIALSWYPIFNWLLATGVQAV